MFEKGCQYPIQHNKMVTNWNRQTMELECHYLYLHLQWKTKLTKLLNSTKTKKTFVFWLNKKQSFYFCFGFIGDLGKECAMSWVAASNSAVQSKCGAIIPPFSIAKPLSVGATTRVKLPTAAVNPSAPKKNQISFFFSLLFSFHFHSNRLNSVVLLFEWLNYRLLCWQCQTQLHTNTL